MVYTDIRDEKLDINECIQKVRDNSAGAITSFIGSVRDITNDKKVLRLFYESHISMAKKLMQKICEESSVKYNLIHVAMIHRVGTLEIGDDAVVLSVSGKHRKDTNSGCTAIIEMLKQAVPIWKKEYFEDGDEWVSNTP